ncbi:MAG TPA: IPT/TIG domain-containing protein, partial [Thermoanaerobaculia bacterium]|nr:IPT/TIG domain-containing protein [Thermoanaerobaculia bacterium]
MRERKSWIAAAAIVALFSACKGESPTAPPTGGGNPPGGTTPPTGVNLTLTTSSTDPLIDSTVIITATATQNNQAVPNGTAVEFETTDGIFDDTANLKETVKTTTNGVATVRLSKSTIGAVTVRATVNNVSRTIGVTFREKPVVTPPPGTAPTISSVSPTIGRPAGGQTIRITGTNFKVPLRVFFTNGGVSPVEGFVVNSTDTTIDVVTPAVNVGAGQQFISDVIVITEAGTPREQRVTRTSAFTFRNESLTPRVSTATPNSGPVTGSTRVTIIGDGFQAPVQVLFGTAEARVITVNFSEILVESPPARDTTSNGSGAFTGPVDITVRNINSATSVVLTQGFSYKNAVQITAMGPTEGIFTGGTRVQIDGTGFVEPVAVVIGGIAARPISVSGTRIIALTSGISITGCSDQGGPTTVTNIVNGDTADGPQFLFRVPKPAIVSVIDVNGPPTLAGESVDVVVANALPGTNRITIGDRTVFITGSTTNSNGTTTFTVTLPTNFTFANQACTLAGVAGTRQVPIDLDVTYLNVQSTCTDTATGALTVEPPTTDCIVPPAPNANITPVTPPCTNMGNVSA